MSHRRRACGLTRCDGMSNEEVYKRFGMDVKLNGIECRLVE